MFPPEVLAAYLAAVLVVVLAPGPDNILAISRGLSQGWTAAAASAMGAGLGIMVHAVAATLGLALVLQTSPLAFWVVKLVGAGYLLWLGYKAILSRNLTRYRRRRNKRSSGSSPLACCQTCSTPNQASSSLRSLRSSFLRPAVRCTRRC